MGIWSVFLTQPWSVEGGHIYRYNPHVDLEHIFSAGRVWCEKNAPYIIVQHRAELIQLFYTTRSFHIHLNEFIIHIPILKAMYR